MDTRNLLTTAEAAERLGVWRRTVQRWILERVLPATRKGTQYLIDVADLARVRGRKPGWPAGRKRGKRRRAKSL